MRRMKANTRLALSLAVIVLSAIYAVLVTKNPALASAIASGYVAVLLTIFLLVNVWKKP